MNMTFKNLILIGIYNSPCIIRQVHKIGGEAYYMLNCDWPHTNMIYENVSVTVYVEFLVAHLKYFAMIIVFVLLHLHVLFLYHIMSVVLVWFI